MSPHVARAELVLSRDPSYPLRQVPLRPDPLSPFARALAQLRPDLEESATVSIGLLPMSFRARRRLRAAVGREASGAGGSWRATLGGGSIWDQVRLGAGHPPRSRGAAARPVAPFGPWDLQRREELRARMGKVIAADPMFEMQVLIRVESEIKGRPEAHLHALIACFDQFSGLNHFRVVGRHLGLGFLGTDALPWRRRRFDRRQATGLFAPRGWSVVSAREIAGLLKPPTAHCLEPNVARSGGVIPPPPPGLPEFTTERPDVLPLGRVQGSEGARLVGVRLEDTVFSYFAGRSRYGKTETAINQFVHLARSGHGCFFLDPHEDAVSRIKPYLTSVADRVVEIHLAPRGGSKTQATWNLFSMRGRGPEDKEARIDIVVNSFASALRWSEINNRALNLTTQAAQSLVELAVVLPEELAPTIFQITTLLSNDEWRAAVLPFLSASSREFWESRFPRLAGDAITAVTNLIDRLRSSAAVSALLGASESSYDVRRCMDAGKVVLACPAGNGDKDRLVANFLVYDVLAAALSRKDTPPDRRRPFYVFFDEVQTYDGASRGNLGALLEQAAKYGVRAFLINQNPERLTPATFDAVTTNRSHLASTVVNARAASLIAREWGGAVAPATIGRLEKYTYLASVTLGPQVTPPFLVRGVPVEDLWSEAFKPEEVPDLEEAITRNVGRRPVAETIAELDTLDDRIYDHLAAQRASRPSDHRAGAQGVRSDHVRQDGSLEDLMGRQTEQAARRRS